MHGQPHIRLVISDQFYIVNEQFTKYRLSGLDSVQSGRCSNCYRNTCRHFPYDHLLQGRCSQNVKCNAVIVTFPYLVSLRPHLQYGESQVQRTAGPSRYSEVGSPAGH